ALWRRLARFALAVGAVEVNRAQAGAAAVRVRAEERVVWDRRKRIVVDSLRLDHLYLTAEQIAQRLAERSPGVGHHLRAAASLQLAADGVGPDQRHAADRSVERQQAVVPQKSDRFDRRRERDRLVPVRPPLAGRKRSIEQAGADDEAHDAPRVVLDLRG